jgi:acyl-CoA thioester hydrolase
MVKIPIRQRTQADLFTYNYPARVYFENTDAGGVVYHTEYLKFMERARTEWLRYLGYSNSELADKHNVIFVLSQINVHYVKPAKLDDLLEVTVEVDDVGRVRAAFNQTVRREAETLVKAQVVLGCVDAKSMKPKEIPKDLQRKMAAMAGIKEDPAEQADSDALPEATASERSVHKTRA